MAVRPDECEEGPTVEERGPRRVADPKKPKQSEIDLHELTHLPFRNWREVCIRGKGKNMPHRTGRQEKGLPELHFDYMFVGPKDAPGETKPCLVIRDVEKIGRAHV